MPSSGPLTECERQRLSWHLLGPGADQTALSGVTVQPLVESHGNMALGHVSAADVSQLGQLPPAQLSALLPSPAIGTLYSPPSLAPVVYPHLLLATSQLAEEAEVAAQAEVAVALHELCSDDDIKRMCRCQ